MSNNFRGIKSLATFDTTNSNKIKSNTINTANIVSNNIQTSAYVSSSVNTVVNVSLEYDETYTVNSNESNNYILAFYIIDNFEYSRNFTIDANTNTAQINDRVVLMFKVTNAGTNDVVCNFSEHFFYTACGIKQTSFIISNFERMVIEFIYDGEKYVNTYDNC
jgi:hypothetical protein